MLQAAAPQKTTTATHLGGVQVVEKQATLAELDAQLGSTSAAAAENRDQIQRLQVQMSELQNEHVAWQRNMLDGRLQELRAAAAQVENNQALQVGSQPCLLLEQGYHVLRKCFLCGSGAEGGGRGGALCEMGRGVHAIYLIRL